MSHFVVYVFTKEDGRGVDELLAPYNEGIEYAPYIQYTREQAIAKVRKDIEDYKNGLYAKYLADPEKYKEECANKEHIDYLENEFPLKLNWTDDECYKDMTKYYDEDMIDENGNILSTYNPNAKWDWYSIGGRWDGNLITKSGENANTEYINKIDWDKSGTPFAYITPNGVWHEKGEMCWWAIVNNEKEEDDWKNEFNKTLDKLKKIMIVW